MKAPFAYYGGKSRMAARIVAMMPPHDIYIEPFLGSGAVFFAKPSSRHEIINDLDDAIVTFLRILRDRPAELAEACRLTPHSRTEWYAADLDEPGMDDLEKARRLWVRVNQSFGKTVAGRSSTGWSSTIARTQAITTTITTRIDRFKAIAERLCQASIECRDAVDVIDQYGRRGAVIYADPPYLDTTRSTTNNGYRVESKTTEHHEQLAAALHATPATVLLSGYHPPLYDRLYDGWDRVEIPVRCSSSNSVRGDRGSLIEVIWSNRPLGAQAFDFGTEAS